MFETTHNERQHENPEPSSAHLRDLLALVPNVVSKLPKLEQLVVNLNEQWRSDGPISYDPSYAVEANAEDVSKEEYRHGLNLQLSLLDQMRSTVASIFSKSGHKIEFLTYLRLTLPCAYDISAIGASISDGVAMHLRDLYLEYIDGTGPGGDLSYLRSWRGGRAEGDENYPFSNLQRRFPNTAYMEGISSLVLRCQNLESLGLVCTQHLDCQYLEWQPLQKGLRSVYIHRAAITSENMIRLLSPSQGLSESCVPNIEAVYIDEVELMGGTWAAVFEHLLECPSLTYLHLYNIVYSKHGTSAHMRTDNDRPYENVTVMWTENEDDEESLNKLVRKVVSGGGEVSDDMEDVKNDAMD
jgi:hypothetical protein